MNRFQVGDKVRIVGLSTSQWRDARGTILEISERTGVDAQKVQECEVNLNGERRWFLADHLIKSIPTKWVRFFRAEASERWQLNPDDVVTLNGDHLQLKALLKKPVRERLNQKLSKSAISSRTSAICAFSMDVPLHTITEQVPCPALGCLGPRETTTKRTGKTQKAQRFFAFFGL